MGGKQAGDSVSVAANLRKALTKAVKAVPYSWNDVRSLEPVQQILAADSTIQMEFVRRTVDDIGSLRETLGNPQESPNYYWNLYHNKSYPAAAAFVSARILGRSLPWTIEDMAFLVNRTADLEGVSTVLYHLKPLISQVEKFIGSNGAHESVKSGLTRLADALAFSRSADDQKLRREVSRLAEGSRELPLDAGEPWAAQVFRDSESWGDRQAAWRSLLEHAINASGSSPSKKWLADCGALLKQIGWDQFRAGVLTWFPLVDKPRTTTVASDWRWEQNAQWAISEESSDALKGLVWCCSIQEDAEVARALTSLALSAYRKLPGIGPRLVKVGNACVWSLGAMPGSEALGQLALLAIRVKFGTAQKMIDKALQTTATRLGIPFDEVMELAAPAYGMSEVGHGTMQIGDFVAEYSIVGTNGTQVVWKRPDGKAQKSPPKSLKSEFPDDMKELTQATKDIQRMLPAQRDRLDQLFLSQKTWPFETWRTRYLDHPLVGVIARGLIWRLTTSGSTIDVVFHEGELHDIDGRRVSPSSDTRVELWHPIGQPVERVLAWRRRLEALGIRQPFKQAHREIYLLTDAEHRTQTYSNRFAAHVLRQHQFNALCAARGWKNNLRLLVDAEYPPATRTLTQWRLRAEFWIEGIGDDYGTDTNESGVFHRVATDQVRFYTIDAAIRTAHAGGGGYETLGAEGSDTPLSLTEVPPLVFSEIMRDVDLFVGVASVGNDPNWADGGPEGRYRDYWTNYAFGDLGETAKTRKAVLENLIPRLEIAPRCSLSDKFLVVRGDIRTYKIHLGSANILMEPNDQYLCIVPAAGAARGATGRVFLPFEGDERLAVILSKALMLADDKSIADTSITRQISPGG